MKLFCHIGRRFLALNHDRAGDSWESLTELLAPQGFSHLFSASRTSLFLTALSHPPGHFSLMSFASRLYMLTIPRRDFSRIKNVSLYLLFSSTWKTEWHRGRSHPLFYAANAHNTHGSTRPKLEPQNSLQVSPISDRGPSAWAIICCLPRFVNSKLHQK